MIAFHHTPPTIQFRNSMRDIILAFDNEVKLIDLAPEIASDFILLQQFIKELSDSIEYEQRERPEYTINYSDFALQKSLLKHLEKSQKKQEGELIGKANTSKNNRITTKDGR